MRTFVLITLALIPVGVVFAVLNKDYHVVPMFIFLFCILSFLLPSKKIKNQ